MPLTAGTRLGPYEIAAQVGAGGMGEVYRARDTRLGRTVAIKVLPTHTADRIDVRQRFEREARAVSALNHPHICTLFDLGSHDGIDYLVMEYLEGDTLADRLKKGPLAIEQTLRIASQTADALDRAHRTGIIHRDLKPGNIMQTKDGVKVMDFGLAKMLDQNAGAVVSGGSIMQTLTSPLTGEGTIVGTLQYMSPEQLEGQEADARSDIFAFGAVVYEMASGRKPFEGKTHASLIAQIMSSEPASLSSIAPVTPAALDRLVRTCLAKDPADRWQSMHDVLLNLRGLGEGGSREGATAQAGVLPKRVRVWMAMACALLVAALAFTAGWFLRRQPETAVQRLMIPAPEKTTFGYGLALSPDGKRLAFVAKASSGQDLLWLRALDSINAQPVSGTEGATFPFWSPDNRSVAFFAEGKLKRVDAAGGTPQTICSAADGRGGSWGRDGTILFTPESAGPLYRVPAGGGAPVSVTKIDSARGEMSHRWPHFLPDARHFFCYVGCLITTTDAIAVGSLGEEQLHFLTNASSAPVYASAGYLLFGKGSTLFAQSFDLGSLRLSGDLLSVVQNVTIAGQTAPTAYGAYAASQTGILTYRTGGAERGQFTWFDRRGKPLGTAGDPGEYAQPALSPDGKRLAFDRNEGDKASLWLLDLAKNITSRFTFGAGFAISPVWSPDGQTILFGSSRERNFELYRKLATGIGNEELLLSSPIDKFPDHWSADGRTIVFETFDAKTKADLWRLPTNGDRKPIPYRQTSFNESHGQVSPNGQWLAYTADDTGRAEIYVDSFPAPGKGHYQISLNGGDEPMWRRDGKELYYRTADRKLMAVPVGSGAGLQTGTPQVLFETRAPAPGITTERNYYVATGDGQKFLVFTLVEGAASSPIVTVLNWASGLKQ